MLWYEKMSIHVGGRQKDAGMAEGEPPGGVREGGLAYIFSDYFVWGVSKLLVNAKLHNKIVGLIQKMKVVMGSLDRGLGHRGEGLLEVNVQDQGCRRR